MPKFKKNTSRFRMKSPFRQDVDLTRKTGLGPRANPNVAQGGDARIEELNDKCMEKGMVWSEGEGKCVKKVVAKGTAPAKGTAVKKASMARKLLGSKETQIYNPKLTRAYGERSKPKGY
tara:strand:- start:503 stop:859 length:357 start_codon:yes stop_codon:yes gene_type:complete